MMLNSMGLCTMEGLSEILQIVYCAGPQCAYGLVWISDKQLTLPILESHFSNKYLQLCHYS